MNLQARKNHLEVVSLERSLGLFSLYFFFPKKSNTAGRIATPPANKHIMPPMIQPAPRLQPVVSPPPLAPAKQGSSMNKKIPATIRATTATKLRMPATLSRVWILSNGKIKPASKIIIATRIRIKAMMADQVALQVVLMPIIV